MVVILTALYPIISVLLALIFLHETVSLKQWCGMLLGMIAIAMIVSK